MADTLLASLTETSVPDESDYILFEDNSGPTSGKLTMPRLLGFLNRGACKGRLTLETGVPVSITDQIGKSTLYWTPIDDGLMTLYDGTRWWGHRQPELSLALSGLTSGKNYDAFLDYNSGTPALVLGPAWTNDTTRATGLTTQDGILVLSGTTTKRYVGTIYTTGTTTTEGQRGQAVRVEPLQPRPAPDACHRRQLVLRDQYVASGECEHGQSAGCGGGHHRHDDLGRP